MHFSEIQDLGMLTKHCVTSGFMHFSDIQGLRMFTKHSVTNGFMFFFSSSQTLKKQKPLQIRSENAFFQFQPNANKPNNHCRSAAKMHFLSSNSRFAHVHQTTAVTQWFYAFFEFQPNAKKANTTADPQRKCIF